MLNHHIVRLKAYFRTVAMFTCGWRHPRVQLGEHTCPLSTNASLVLCVCAELLESFYILFDGFCVQ